MSKTLGLDDKHLREVEEGLILLGRGLGMSTTDIWKAVRQTMADYQDRSFNRAIIQVNEMFADTDEDEMAGLEKEVFWGRHVRAMNKAFQFANFDTLEGMGYPIWANARDDEYTSALIEYERDFRRLSAYAKASKLMHAYKVSVAGLLGILKEY